MLKKAIHLICLCILQFGIIYAVPAKDYIEPKGCSCQVKPAEIQCKHGFYNFLTEGGGYAIGDLTYQELEDFFCKPCREGYYCPGDNRRYKCDNADLPAMDTCPELSPQMRRVYKDLQNFRMY
jgi:hypothetical protein